MKCSLIVINYNDAVRVGRAIEACLNQTHKDIEVIVVDDGSNEETRKEYVRFGDKIKMIQLERTDEHERNPSRPRNAGIKVATGEFMAVLDSDNFYSPEFVEEMVKGIEDVAFCNWEIFGLQKYTAEIEKKWEFKHSVMTNYLMHTHLDHQCLLMRTELVREVGCYDERLARSQDCDLLIRLMLATNKWMHVPKVLFHFERHEEDQMKTIASAYGKMLWFLKNNINIAILLQGYVRGDYNLALSMYKAMEDFKTLDIWKEDFEKSEYKKQLGIHKGMLDKEWHE